MRNQSGIYMGCLLGLLLLIVGQNCRADDQPTFANRQLKEIAENMPVRHWPRTDTICAMPEVFKGKSIVVRYNDKQEIAHLGISLFSDMTKQMLDKTICNFLERFFLELSVQKSAADIKRKLKINDSHLSYNGEAFGSNKFHSIANVLRSMGMPVDFSFRSEEKTIKATWTFGAKQTLTLQFPASRELIEGKDKKESDDEWSDRLSSTSTGTPHKTQQEQVKENILTAADGGEVWVREGETYGVKQLTSASYYQKSQGSMVPLYDKKFIGYSLKNLFQIPTGSQNIELQITHRKYGHFTPRFTVKLSDFLSLFQEDFMTYSAATQNKEGNWVTTVVFYHRYLSYIHLLRIITTGNALFTAPIVLSADFYSNIPQHYIKSLF